MQLVLTEGYRGLSLMVDLALDRILVPVAIIVALAGAALIGVELSALLAPEIQAPFTL